MTCPGERLRIAPAPWIGEDPTAAIVRSGRQRGVTSVGELRSGVDAARVPQLDHGGTLADGRPAGWLTSRNHEQYIRCDPVRSSTVAPARQTGGTSPATCRAARPLARLCESDHISDSNEVS